MNNRQLYDHALTMLTETNTYSRPPEEMRYRMRFGEVCSLPGLIGEEVSKIKDQASKKGKRWTIAEYNEICFDAIGNAMATYMEHYPAPVSFKKRTRERFVSWLEVIRTKYGISREKLIPEQLIPDEGENDTVVGLLLSLQARRGVTKKELKDRLGIGLRAILKDLCKLDPTLREEESDNTDKVTPFYLGGQPVRAKIDDIKIDGKREKRYRTENSIHPLILQENLFQAATLLQALQRNYNEHDSTVSSYLAVDIWSQLSDYARERIEYVFAAGDPDFADFLEMLKDETPDERVPASFRSERDMFNEEWPIHERLLYYMKAERMCSKLQIETEDGEILLSNVRIKMRDRSIRSTSSRGGENRINKIMFSAVTENGDEIPFEEADIIDIL